MSALVEVGLSNAVAALVLAVVALLAGLCRLRPAVVHALWLLVLLKLVTPPLVRIPVPLPAPAAAAGPTAKPAEEAAPAPAEEPADPEDNDVIALPPLREELIVRADEDAQDGDVVTIASLPPAAPWPWTSWLAGAWIAGSAVWFGVAWLRLWRFGQLLRHGQEAPETVLRRVRRLSKRLTLQPPEVRLLPGRLAPMVWGLGRPLLLLPVGLEEQVGSEGLDTLLLHELSHLKRGDHHVRWLEFFALGLYWWLPVAWYARRELREAEEQCCDAWVVRTMPAARKLYATALVEALDFLSQPVTATPPLASALGEVADLKRRLTLIMRGTTPHLLGRPLGLAVFGLALAALPLVPGLGLAQKPRLEDRKGEIRFADNPDAQRIQEEIRRKKEEIEALARKLEQAAREKAESAKKKSQELRDKIRRDVEVQLAEVIQRKGNVIRIEITGESMKPEELKELSKKVKELVPGENRKVTVTVGGGSMIHWVKPQPPKTPEAAKAPMAPKAPELPSPPPPGQRGPRGPRGEGDRRLDSLERRLEGIMQELESLRKEMRGPGRRPGFEGGFGGGFGRGDRRDEGAPPKEAPKPRGRQRSPDEAK